MGLNCSISLCDDSHYAKKLCRRHYDRKRKHGSPHKFINSSKYDSIEDRLLRGRKIVKGCWVWTRRLNRDGYGEITITGISTRRVPRVSYELYKGKIPKERVVDHLCRNRACFNPDHLELVTYRENVIRGRNLNREKTHCPRGHEYTPDNTYKYNNSRHCRTCSLAVMRRNYLERKAKNDNRISA